MHSYIRPYQYVAFRLPSDATKIIRLEPNTCVPYQLPIDSDQDQSGLLTGSQRGASRQIRKLPGKPDHRSSVLPNIRDP